MEFIHAFLENPFDAARVDIPMAAVLDTNVFEQWKDRMERLQEEVDRGYSKSKTSTAVGSYSRASPRSIGPP